MNPTDLLPGVSIIILLVWHAYETRQFEKELFNIFAQEGLPPPNTAWYPFKRNWEDFLVKANDPDVIKIKKKLLLQKIYKCEIICGVFFVVSFLTLSILAEILHK
jgi:hypothetical protein